MTKAPGFYSVADLVAFALPCLPKSRQGLEMMIARENWLAVEIPGTRGRGGVKREFQPPAPVAKAIKEVLLNQALKNAPATVATINPSGGFPSLAPGVPCDGGALMVATGAGAVGALKAWQKRTAEARVAILREVDRIAELVGREKAIMKVVIMAQEGTLPPYLAQLVPIANARSGADGKRTLSRRTVYDWFKGYKPGVQGVNALAPKDQHASIHMPAWAPDLLEQYQRPQKPSLAWAVEQIADKHGIDQDSLYHRARRFLSKMGNVELQAGRMGPRDLKNIKPFIRRDSSVLWPAEVYSADGHTFDAEVAHPVHGRPFRPEITSVRDIATRRLVGWSIDLAESGLAVLDALRHACETGGICSLFYVDHGSGFDNALQSAPGIGMESRLGYTKTHSLPYNSQARGVVEKGHKDIWVRAAKQLPTYIGATMDAEAKNKVFKLTRRDIRVSGASKYLMAWPDFVRFVEQHADQYNNRPHRSLAMTYDAALGKKRHMTPNEAWQQGVNAGADLVTITAEESRELFRPQREVKVLRGEVRLFNNLYFSKELTEYNGDIVRVAYDVHDASQVWVYDQQGRFICSAEFEANKRAYFPEAFLEQAARKRAQGRLSRIDVKREEIMEELEGKPMRDVDADVLEISHNPGQHLGLVGELPQRGQLQSVDVHHVDIEPEVAAPMRPIFMLESERYEWLMQNRDDWQEGDTHFLRQFVASDIYKALQERFELLGLAWDGDGEEVFSLAV